MHSAGLNNWIDIVTLVIYFLLVFAVGLWINKCDYTECSQTFNGHNEVLLKLDLHKSDYRFELRQSVCRKEKRTVKGYFLAGRSMQWIPIGASLFASNIGSEHFIGLAGSGAASGIAVVAFEWGAVLLLILLGWIFLPVYIKAGIFTIPEYLSKRFGGQRLRIYLSVMALIFAVLTKISVDIFAGAVFIQQALGWNIYMSIVIFLGVTAVYTVAGGLATVIITDTLHTVVMLIGSFALSILAFIKVGGYEALKVKYMEAMPSVHYSKDFHYSINVTDYNHYSNNVTNYINYSNNVTNYTMINTTITGCGYPPADAFHIFRDPLTSNLPWPGVLIRSTFISVWYWCTDQVIVQRTLAARNIAHARAGTILAGYLKILPLFLIIFPGMISRVLFTDAVACADPETCMSVCENPAGCSNVAYPQLVLGLAPLGMRGVMIAVIVAAVMSSLTSIFNSTSTIFTMDIWRRFRKHATDRELLIVGRIFVVVLVLISVAWVPLIKSAEQGQLFIYIQAINGYMAPPVCALFLLAIFVPRVNEKGAFAGLIIGQTIGIVRMVLDFVYSAPNCGETDDRPDVVSKVNFTYLSAGLLLITTSIMVVVSFLTEKQQISEVEELTFWSSIRKFYKNVEITGIQDSLNAKDVKVLPSGNNQSLTLESVRNGKRNEGDIDIEKDGADKDNESLYIKPLMNWILNINAVIVICVFIALYAVFH